MSIDTSKKITKVTVDGEEMPLGGVDVSDTTATAADVLAGKVFYGADEQKKTGTLETYTGTTDVTPSGSEQVLPTAGKVLDDDITVHAASVSTVIRAAELANVDFVLTDSADQQVGTASTGDDGGEVEFSVAQAGTYKLYAYSSGTLLWSNTSIIVDTIGVIIVVPTAKSLDNYTDAEIHTACDKGFAHTMFAIGAMKKHVQAGSILNNMNKFIEDIVTIGGKDYIDWRFANKAGTTYNINPKFGYLTSSSATSWANTYSSNGGEKYSAMQQRFMLQGEAVYSQARGILPDDYSGTLTTGIKMSEIYYTDQNGAKSKLYDYDKATDTFAEATSAIYSSSSVAQQTARFVKGYFKSVGAIDEPTFNAGYYYTYDGANFVYTRATTYTSGTTYYGFYETLQENGVFYDAISSLSPYLVKRALKASAGGTQTTYLSEFEAYVNLPCIENMFGVNRSTTLKSGTAATNANAYNLVGEGSKLKVYDDWSYLCIGSEYWTRSANSTNSNSFCTVVYTGSINSSGVNVSSGVRAGFRTC